MGREEEGRSREGPRPEHHQSADAILKVTTTAICGSDLHLYDGYIPTMKKGDILGHEFMGEVVAPDGYANFRTNQDEWIKVVMKSNGTVH